MINENDGYVCPKCGRNHDNRDSSGGGPKQPTKIDPKELAKKWDDLRKKAGRSNTSGEGTLGFDRFIRGLVKPKVNWRNELRNFVSSIFNESDYAYSDRRFTHSGMHMNTLKDIGSGGFEDVVVAIDTSGSIGEAELNTFASELMELFKEYDINDCYIVWCDDAITNIQQVSVGKDNPLDISKLRPKGYGGTSFIPPFKWINGDKNIPYSSNCPLSSRKIQFPRGSSPAFIIYFTDGDVSPVPTPTMVSGYRDRVFWVIKGKDNAGFIKFGKKIFVDTIK